MEHTLPELTQDLDMEEVREKKTTEVPGFLCKTLVPSPIVRKALPSWLPGGEAAVYLIKDVTIELHRVNDDGTLTCLIQHPMFKKIRDAQVLCFKESAKLDIGVNAQSLTREPDVLAYTSMDGTLAFLRYAPPAAESSSTPTTTGKPRFRYSTVEPASTGTFGMCGTYPLGTLGDDIDQIGQSLALDPLGRAGVVAATQNRLAMFSIRKPANDTAAIVIQETQSIEVPGVIWHAMFLTPPTFTSPIGDDEETKSSRVPVHLMVYIYDTAAAKPRVLVYQWFPGTPLSTLYEYGNMPLPTELSLPLHMTALNEVKDSALIVTETEACLFEAGRIRSGDLAFVRAPLPKGAGLVTGIATSRQASYADDYVYLLHETGRISRVDACTTEATVVNAGQVEPGSFAFAVLDMDMGTGDLVFAGGAMCSSGVYLLSTDGAVTRYFELPNLSPVFDFDVYTPPDSTSGQQRLLVTHGRSEGGMFSELRTGLPLRVHDEVGDFENISGLWSAPDTIGHRVFVFITYPWNETNCLCYDYETREIEDVTDALGVDSGKETLAVGRDGERLVQVTRDGVISLAGRTEPDVEKTSFAELFGMGSEVLAANVLRGQLVVGSRHFKTGETRLLPRSLPKKEGLRIEETPGSWLLSSEPTFLSQYDLPLAPSERPLSGRICIAGTLSSEIVVCNIDPFSALTHLCTQKVIVSNGQEYEDAIPESAVVIANEGWNMLLVGARTGHMLLYRMMEEGTQLQLVDTVKLGSRPVKIRSHSKTEAYVASDAVWKVIASQAGDVTLAEMVMEQGLESISLVSKSVDGLIDASPILPCISGTALAFAEVGKEVRLCTRSIPLEATPRRVITDHKGTGAFTVLTNISTETSGVTRSDIKYIDIASGALKTSYPLATTDTDSLIFKDNEVIYSIFEWSIQLRPGVMYHYVCAGTGWKGGVDIGGRLHFLNFKPSKDDPGRSRVKRLKPFRTADAVVAIASIASFGVVYSTLGKQICVRTLNVNGTDNKVGFSPEEVTFKLRSAATRISVKDNVIYCSTQRDSVVVLTYDQAAKKIAFLYSDPKPRLGLDHWVRGSGLVLASDKSGYVWGFVPSMNGSQQKRSFQVKLPVAISRMKEASLLASNAGTAGSPEGFCKVIICSGIDGSIFGLSQLPAEAYNLLHLVQKQYFQAIAAVRGETPWEQREILNGTALQALLGMNTEQWKKILGTALEELSRFVTVMETRLEEPPARTGDVLEQDIDATKMVIRNALSEVIV
ncbi:hypothetical protein SAICODRAFT_69424 [Saitoella complicata NRRL Y-17804]|uniref:DNA damage-binding protein 1 n=1 Tax=Saitoella complicata (strain BCRC 22490 / CBS 7301 / JCM 7358 / NBRC 10748 / NRRL Y-17804) TaxID=698492 RepID=A0A0E9NN14_SAICN|nr:uncharacterized protein SAICODRAFT_69424 [Saitoella complicata NRRL Y-17804]ODQ55432.1 hypothetical protein SAICODRAFT_69424 [Saitoella complicata NRRL Y-17804]GAO51224.1 hypothetical protein G7K_5332-t1 [Saitoella complicata NRRL Y-17804]